MHTPTPPDEVMTLTQAWLEKAVIGLNLCPFAKAVYVKPVSYTHLRAHET